MTLPITVGIFSILVYLIAQTKVVRQMTTIADHYFNTDDVGAGPHLAVPRLLPGLSGASRSP